MRKIFLSIYRKIKIFFFDHDKTKIFFKRELILGVPETGYMIVCSKCDRRYIAPIKYI